MIKFRMTVWIGNLHYLILNTGKLIRMTEFGKNVWKHIQKDDGMELNQNDEIQTMDS